MTAFDCSLALEPASPTGESESDEPTTGESSNSEPKEQDDENFSDVPFHKHPRFQQVIAQRNQFREGHEAYQNIQGFLQQRGLSQEEAVALIVNGFVRDVLQHLPMEFMAETQKLIGISLEGSVG